MILNRISKSPEGIFSLLIDEQGNTYHCAEHAYNSLPKIPDGEFICIRGQHQLHDGPIETFEITGVEGHTGILFHYGNNPQIDSDGCVLLGTSQEGNTVINSRIAFKAFMTTLDGIDSFQLSVK